MLDVLLRRWHRLRQPRLRPIDPLRPVTLTGTDRGTERLLASRALLERILHENVVPFWAGCLDREDGGYLLNHGPDGRWKGPSDKATIPQARTLWFFSRLARERRLPEAESMAKHGFTFLRDRLRDAEHGGFVWSVGHDGASVVDGSKRVYAQAFALYGISEYALATGDPEAMGLAEDTAAVLERRFRDDVHGGYHAEFEREWGAPQAGTPASRRAARKTVNDHIHVLEALSAYHALDPAGVCRDRISELILILTGTALRKSVGACTDGHLPDWTPMIGNDGATVSYGHDVESVWLVMDACDALGIPSSLVVDWGRTLADHALRWGWDRRQGGLFLHGPVGGPAFDRRKVWWAQAETMVGALRLHRVTGDTRYADLYLDALRWIDERQVDWAAGEWHATVEPGGGVSGDKANLWKSPYHNGRALMRCLELLVPGDPTALPA